MSDSNFRFTDLLEAVCWYINTTGDDCTTVDQIAADLNAEWTETHRAVITLVRLQYILPSFEYNESIESVTPARSILECINSNAVRAVLHVFICKRYGEDSITETFQSSQASVKESDWFADGIKQAERLGWAATTENGVELTPTGISIVGPLCCRIAAGVKQTDSG